MMHQHSNIRIRVGALILQKGRILLVSHKKNEHIYWLLPGGGVDYSEKLPDALKREIFEELNAEIEVQDIVLVCDSIEPEGGRHIVHIIFRCHLKTEELRLGDEPPLHGYQFFLPQEIPHIMMFPAINDDILDVLSGRNGNVYREKIWVPL